MSVWAADATPELEDSQFCVINDNELRIVTGTPADNVDMVLGAQSSGVIDLDSKTEANAGLDVNGKFVVNSTTDASLPCPSMTEAQRDLLTPSVGECVYNSDTLELNVYNGAEWVLVGGGGLDKWAASTDYEVDDVVWLADDNHIYVATADHTSGTSFNAANWDELSDSEDRLEKFPTETNDNRVVRTDVDGSAVQGSLVEIDDLGAMSGLTGLTVDNLNIDGNTISSTSGNIALDPTGNLTSSEVLANEVLYGDASGHIGGDPSFLYQGGATDKLRAGGLDFEDDSIVPYTVNADLGLSANGTGVVNVTSETNVNNLNFTGSSILGTNATEDLTISAESTRRVEIENILIEDNEIYSETASPLLITPSASQPVSVDGVDIMDGTLTANQTDSDLLLVADGAGEVKIDRGGVQLQAGSNNPEQGEFIVDTGFEYGVGEWSCTDATVSQVAGAGLKGSAAARITFTADGGYCDLVKTFSGDDNNQRLLVGSYVKTSDANVTFHPIKAASKHGTVEVDMAGEYYTLTSQIYSSGVTGFRIKGNNTEAVDLDLATNRLGGYEVGVSKNCTTKLDCENTLTGFYDSSEATLADAVKDQTPSQWITNTAKSGTGGVDKTFTVSSGVFSSAPNCTASTDDGNSSSVMYRKGASTSTNLLFRTRDNSNTQLDESFVFSCTKAPADFKPLGQKGVAITGSSAGAELVVTTEGVGSNTTVGNATVTVPFDTIKRSSLISWDTGSYEGEFLKSGKFSINSSFSVINSSAAANFFFFPEINRGSGFVALEDDSNCNLRLDSASDSTEKSCPFVFEANKGNVIRMRVQSDNANSILRTGPTLYPRMIITPVLDQETVTAEFATHRKSGVERQTADTYDGKIVYEYCNEVATDITSNTTLETIDSGLEPIGVLSYQANIWSILPKFSGTGSSDFRSEVIYNSSDGDIEASAGAGGIVAAGTRYCMRYTR